MRVTALFILFVITCLSGLSQTPPELIQEPWYLDYMEINGEIVNYPASQDLLFNLHTVSDFTVSGELIQNYICFSGGGSTYSVYEENGTTLIDISFMTLFADDCSEPLANAFDNAFTTQIESKTHTYAIIDEGLGRRLILTDENGSRLVYTNSFLSTPDIALNGFWYFKEILSDDIVISAPGESIPYLTVDIANNTWEENVICNSYNAHFTTTQDKLQLYNSEATMVDCESAEENDFEDIYLDSFIGVNDPFREFNYSILEMPQDGSRLVLSGLDNEVHRNYSRFHPIIPQEFEENWVLKSMENNNSPIDIPENTFSSFTVEIGPEFSTCSMNDNCVLYEGSAVITDSSLSLDGFLEALDDCTNGGATPVLDNALSDFYAFPENQTMNYQIINGDNIAARQLIMTKDNGDEAIYVAKFSETLESLTLEPWFLDYYEIDGIPFTYPTPDDLQFDDFNITTFDTQGGILQQLTCWSPTSSIFEVAENEEILEIEIGSINVVAPNCGASVSFSFDINFLGQFSNKKHSVEIIEEGQGRRLVLTDDNGDRIFYTNEFLGIDDISAESLISIFPNPATETLHIALERQDFRPHTLTIFNMQGQELRQADFIPEIDVSSLPSGLYFIKLSDGSIEGISRFLKK